MSITTRFAPSPTGYLHIGGLRTALYCYLWAKKNNGKFILRIEDTDRTRFVPGAIESLLKSLESCGINNDEGPQLKNGTLIQQGEKGPYIQSERLPIYQKYIQQLIDEDKAYYCFCTKEELETVREEQLQKGEKPKYNGKCANLTKAEVQKRLENNEPYVIRMHLPKNQNVVFEDAVRGTVSINTDDMDEQVLIKADGFPTYHFAVVIDDHLMGVTDIIRGEEWLVSTPKHILLYDAFGWEHPRFVHLPTVLNTNKKKLSKRDGATNVEEFLDKGYLPEALINYIALLGWSPTEETKEIFSLNELESVFDLKRINKSGAVFDIEKLNWFNAQYIKKMDNSELKPMLLPYLEKAGYVSSETNLAILDYICETVKEKLHLISECCDLLKPIFDCQIDLQSAEIQEVLAYDTNKTLFTALKSQISKTEEVNPENAWTMLKSIQKEYKIKGKSLFMPVRVALTGILHGPDLTHIMAIIGKEKLIERLNNIERYI